MNVSVFSDYQKLSAAAAAVLLSCVQKNPRLKICLATGATPTLTYQLWVQGLLKQNIATDQLTIIKLDEWGGLPMNHPSTCEAYLQQHVVKPLGLRFDQLIGFHSQPKDPDQECYRLATAISQIGGIDICTLGIGKNGHLGLNEPSQKWSTGPHRTTLSESSLQHSMLAGDSSKVRYGLTLGIENISSSKALLVLASGEEKSTITERALAGPITPSLPASILQQLPQAQIFLDAQAASRLTL